ncbi:MAG: ribose-5-phosphate isomerase RpiA [Methanospirillaceae archaeon]|nr:ribose-5-phosphate isomerase RpiA [Methanospirillaceae archaeon]
MDITRIKQMAGEKAATMVHDGMIVGLGTGSTVAYTIEKLGERIKTGLCIQCIPTSIQTAMRAMNHQIPLTSLDLVSHIDITIDGADQIDPTFQLIKGRGAAHVREKIVAQVSDLLLIVADQSKCVSALTGPIPVEVIAFGLYPVILALKKMGGTVIVREGQKKDGPVISDNGNIVIDYTPDFLFDPVLLESVITMLPGVVGCGIFSGFTKKTRVIIAGDTGCRIVPAQSEDNGTGLI